MTDPYELADRINRVPRGMALTIPRHEIADIPEWPELTGRTGWQHVLDNVMGSAHRSEWRFDQRMNGDVDCYRMPESTAV